MNPTDKSQNLEGRLIANRYITADGLFHYTSCGLDNIYLKDGYVISKDEEHYAIERLEELHDCIARTLIEGKHDLSGRELRFLRKELYLTQSQVAKMMGVDVQSVARWEKGKSKNTIADRFVRTLYLSMKYPQENQKIQMLLNSISDLDIKEHNQWLFEQDSSWHSRAA